MKQPIYWEIASGKAVEVLQVRARRRTLSWGWLQDPIEGITSVCFSPDSGIAVTGTLDGTIRVWRVEKGRDAAIQATLKGHTGEVTRMKFSPDGRLL